MSTQGGISIPLPTPKIRKGPIGRFFRRLKIWTETVFSPAAQARADATLAKVADILYFAMRAVEQIALATPTKADDEFIAVIRQHQLEFDQARLTDESKRLILRQAAVAALRQLIVVEKGLAVLPGRRILNTAIELAYVLYRAGQGDEA